MDQFTFTTSDFEIAQQIMSLLAAESGESRAERPITSRASANRRGGRGGGSASASADEGPPFDPPYVGDDENDADGPEDDPWASSGPSRSKASGGRSGRSRGGSGGSGVRTKEVGAPSGFQRWEFGHEDAPDCECDEPAAKVSGWKGKDSPTGKPSWVAWRCAKGAGRDWKNKCDFFEGTR